MPKLRLDQMAMLCRLYQCSIDVLEQAVKESMQENNSSID
jgi:hypothetical protein